MAKLDTAEGALDGEGAASARLSAAAREINAQLESSGVLASVRAQLHAAIASSLRGQCSALAAAEVSDGSHGSAVSRGAVPHPPPRVSADNPAELAAAGLVLDFLAHWGLSNTLAVAELEARWPERAAAAAAATAAADERAAGGIGAAGGSSNGERRPRPLLTALLDARAAEWDWRLPLAPPSGQPLREQQAAATAQHEHRLEQQQPYRQHAPPPREPIVFARTHAGGSGLDRQKVNQDAFFVARHNRRSGSTAPGATGSVAPGARAAEGAIAAWVSAGERARDLVGGEADEAASEAPFEGGARARSLVTAGVFDGHGAAHGQVAARAACAAVKAAISRRGFVAALEHDAAAVLRAVFAEANEAAVAAMSMEPGVLRQGTGAHSLLLQRAADNEEENIEGRPGGGGDGASADGDGGYLDVTDGGTTASLVIVLDARWLFTAAAGDSSGLLLSWPGGEAGRARAVRLWRDHTPLDQAEFMRMHGLGARFVYDLPTLFDGDDEQRPIWALDKAAGRPRVSAREEARARAVGVACKSVRGELSTLVLSPPSERFSQIGLTVTRSLGDVYMHSFGVSPEPEVHVLDLHEPARGSAASASRGRAAPPGSAAESEVAIVLGTDGMWDLWTHEHVADALWACDGRAFDAFCEATRAEGERKFGEASDNITTVVIRVALPFAGGA